MSWHRKEQQGRDITPTYTLTEKEMATCSSTLAWRIPRTEEPGGLLSIGVAQSRKRLSMLSCTGEGNGNPLQCSCLENPRDRGACWAAVHGVAQSRTWLKRLSLSSIHSEGRGPLWGPSLVAHWERTCWSMPLIPGLGSNLGLIPGPGRSCMPRGNKDHVLQYWAWALKPWSCNSCSPCNLQPMLQNERSPGNEKPTPHNSRAGPSPCN